MKYKIIENVEKKTITVVLGEVRFYSAKYLLERFEGRRYFGSGILETTQEEMGKLLRDISSGLNNVKPEVKVSPKTFFEGDDNPYPLFKRHEIDGDYTGKFEVVIGALADKRERDLFFRDLGRDSVVKSEDEVREYEWGIELEISSKIDDDTLEVKTFVALHRMVRGKKAETQYSRNDDAWGGFDLGVEEEEVEETFVVEDDDLPF